MSLHTINEMRNSESLLARVTAAASKAGVLTADQWSSDQMLTIVSAPGWDTAWAYAVDTYNVNLNPDTGARDDVINDGMITAEVQARIDALIAVEPDGTDPSWLDPSKKPKEPALAKAAAKAEQDSGSLPKQPVGDQRHKADPKRRPPADTRRATPSEPGVTDPITEAHQAVQRPFPPESERRSGNEDHTT
jgi:hypothetical protein